MTRPVGPLTLVLSNPAMVSGLSAVTQALIGVFFILGGKLAGISALVPVELTYRLLRGWLSVLLGVAAEGRCESGLNRTALVILTVWQG